MCPPMLFKLRPCIQKLCNVYYPPTPSLGWIGQIKGRSMSLASARSTSWLVYSLNPRSLTLIWSWMQGCTKPMPTHAHQSSWAWAWVWAPNVGLWWGSNLWLVTLMYHLWSLHYVHELIGYDNYYRMMSCRSDESFILLLVVLKRGVMGRAARGGIYISIPLCIKFWVLGFSMFWFLSTNLHCKSLGLFSSHSRVASWQCLN